MPQMVATLTQPLSPSVTGLWAPLPREADHSLPLRTSQAAASSASNSCQRCGVHGVRMEKSKPVALREEGEEEERGEGEEGLRTRQAGQRRMR